MGSEAGGMERDGEDKGRGEKECEWKKRKKWVKEGEKIEKKWSGSDEGGGEREKKKEELKWSKKGGKGGK